MSASGTAGIDGAQRVVLHVIDSHHLYGSHHALEGGAASTVVAVGVVYVFRTVERYAYKETVVAEEVAPLGCQQQTIGL